jgi:membrane-associated phospholipid phosphatase
MMAVAGLVLACVVAPFDPLIGRVMQGVKLGGDLKREMEFIQQFGAVTSLAIVAAAIWLLDPTRRRELLRGGAAVLATSAAAFVLKTLIGRPRPRLGDPWGFCMPWQTYTWNRGDVQVTRHAWEFWQSSSDLWSMPSSHTSAAFVLACVLSRMYPALRPLVMTIAVIVGVCRVVVGAHYPSDVVIGATLGLMVGSVFVHSLPRTAKALRSGACARE